MSYTNHRGQISLIATTASPGQPRSTGSETWKGKETHMRFQWVFTYAGKEQPIVLTELDGLCETAYALPGGWQCQGNGMLTVIRQMLQYGYIIERVW
jgi:hypothetical protein